jgi:hypothetical protein
MSLLFFLFCQRGDGLIPLTDEGLGVSHMIAIVVSAYSVIEH